MTKEPFCALEGLLGLVAGESLGDHTREEKRLKVMDNAVDR